MEILAAVVLFGACFAAMSLGVLLGGRPPGGGCHGEAGDCCGACDAPEKALRDAQGVDTSAPGCR